jgi:hypothetical protein
MIEKPTAKKAFLLQVQTIEKVPIEKSLHGC